MSAKVKLYNHIFSEMYLSLFCRHLIKGNKFLRDLGTSTSGKIFALDQSNIQQLFITAKSCTSTSGKIFALDQSNIQQLFITAKSCTISLSTRRGPIFTPYAAT